MGQPAFATALTGSQSADDGGLIWEWWYEVQVTENITITAALIDLSRPLGQTTPLGERQPSTCRGHAGGIALLGKRLVDPAKIGSVDQVDLGVPTLVFDQIGF